MQELKVLEKTKSSSQLSKRDFRRLLGISIFQKRERLNSKALLMKINTGLGQTASPFFWFGDAWFADKLSPDQTLYCFPSGRIQIDQTENFIKAMAQHCLDELLVVQPEGPYLLGGFCFDAWIAYEVAQLLHEMGHKTALTLMVECYTLDEEEQRFNTYAHHLKSLGTGSLKSRLKYLSEIGPWKDKENDLSDKPIDSLGVADQVNLLTKIAIENYDRQPTTQGIELIFGSESWHSSCYKFGRFIPNHKIGWFKTATAGISTHFTTGTHDTILEEPNVDLLAKFVQSCVDQTRHELWERPWETLPI